MINIKVEKDIKMVPLSSLKPGDIFAYDEDEATDGVVYLMLDQSDVCKCIDFESKNIAQIPRNSIFAIHLLDGEFTHFDGSMEVIELHNVQLSYRI